MSGLDNWISEHIAVNREDPTLILRTLTKTRCGGVSLYPPGLQASLAKLLELNANEILLKNTNLKSKFRKKKKKRPSKVAQQARKGVCYISLTPSVGFLHLMVEGESRPLKILCLPRDCCTKSQ